MAQPRVLKSSQNLHLRCGRSRAYISFDQTNTSLGSYELPYRVHTAKAYPLPSSNGSEIIIYGHENGVSIVWRGGRSFKPSPSQFAAPQKTNGAANAIISLDSDDDEESAKFEDRPEFEEDEEELDTSRPYPAILQTLDLNLGTAVHHLSLLPPSVLRTDGSSYRGLASLKQNLVFSVVCVDSTIRLITLPLTPPSPASKARADFRAEFTLANAGQGRWGETVIILNGHHKAANTISMTVDVAHPADPQYIIASHSTEVQGLLLLFRVSVKSLKPVVEPFQTIYLSSPARCISFNPDVARERSSHLLVADSTGVCRIYDYKLLVKSIEEPSDLPLAERGTWLLSLYAGFHGTKSDALQNLGTHTGFGRKSIIDAQWVSSGRAVIILMTDGEWAVWDIEGVGPNAAKGLLGRQGIKGGSTSEYSLSGYLDGVLKSKISGPPQIAASKFVPMTPGTRRSTAPFSSKGTTGTVHGQISVSEFPAASASSPAYETVLLWYGDTYAVIPDLAKYWSSYSRKIGGSGNLFGGSSGGRMTKLETVDLQGERCSGIELLSTSDTLILAEHRYVIVSSNKPSKETSFERSTARLSLTERSANNGGDLDVVGIDQALARMENGMGTKRKIFQS